MNGGANSWNELHGIASKNNFAFNIKEEGTGLHISQYLLISRELTRETTLRLAQKFVTAEDLKRRGNEVDHHNLIWMAMALLILNCFITL